MIQLALVRHAKSDWGDEALSDHNRPLNGRGMRDAPVMAGRFADDGFTLDVIRSSTALRARTTAEAFGAVLGVAVDLVPDLYGASPGTLLATAAATPARAVMIVAHDPGLSILAADLSRGGITHMPTCAVATFAWSTTDWEVATATDPDTWTFATPR